jgi:hypothetical protein
MQQTTPPSLNAQVEALAIAFVELSKMLGREQVISVLQVASAIESAAKGPKVSVEAHSAVVELARRLRN